MWITDDDQKAFCSGNHHIQSLKEMFQSLVSFMRIDEKKKKKTVLRTRTNLWITNKSQSIATTYG